MADVNAAIDYVLHREDAAMTGAIVELKDGAGKTRFGLTSRWHADLAAQGYFGSMPEGAALAMAMATYRSNYARPLQLAQIVSQDLANHMLSFAVNDGVHQGVVLLQQAINVLTPHAVQVDGIVGNATLLALQCLMPVSILNALRLQEIAFYRDLAEKNESDRGFLLGWVNRALA